MSEWRQIPGWPDYEIDRYGCVRKVSTEAILRPRCGQVRLAHDRTHRTWRKVDALVLETFKKMYIVPMVSSLSEPGEIWRHVIFAHDYMISSHKRVWRWKTCGFVGKMNCNGKMDVLFSNGKTMGIDKIYGIHFGYDIPTLEGEEWRESMSPGIFVSSLGRLFSTWNLSLMTPQQRPNGYLFIEGRDRRWPVHRLVAFAFVGGHDLLRNSIDHINEDKTDNRAVNLRWCTNEENTEFYLANHPGGARKGEADIV